MHDTIARMRDATFQNVADRCDARWGVTCFDLARAAAGVHVVGFAVAGTMAIVSGKPGTMVGGTLLLCAAAAFGVAAVVGGTLLARFERRAASSVVRALVPALRQTRMMVLDALLLAICAACVAGMAASLGWDVANGHRGAASALALLSMMVAVSQWPVAGLFAACEWKRLHHPSFSRDGAGSLPAGV